MPEIADPSQSPRGKEFVIIQADGLYPVSLPHRITRVGADSQQDDTIEQEILRANVPEDWKITYLQLDLFPMGVPTPKPWSAVPKDLREKVNGILVLKIGFTAEDLALFPRLKV